MAYNANADDLDTELTAAGYSTLRLSRDTLVVTDLSGPEALNDVTATAEHYGAEVDHTVPADQVKLHI